MKALRRDIVIIFFVMLFPLTAQAWRDPIGNCAKKATWKDYFLGTGLAVVQFQSARKINDPDAIGRLNTSVCYTVGYVAKTKTFVSWYSASPANHSSNSPTQVKTGLSGDPMRNEINVFGVILIFNQAGEVFNRKGDIVGQLVCYQSDECGGF
jgi:hypothetical protein